jgi:hypothetical protein
VDNPRLCPAKEALARDADARHQSSLVERDLQQKFEIMLIDLRASNLFQVLVGRETWGLCKRVDLDLAQVHTFVKHDVERCL